jgi:hypothetical protein
MRLLLLFTILISTPASRAFFVSGSGFKTSDNIYSKEIVVSEAFNESLWDVRGFGQNVEYSNQTGDAPTNSYRLDVGYFLKKSETEKLYIALGGLHVDTPFNNSSKLVGSASYEKKIDQLQWMTTAEKRGLPESQRSTSIAGAALTETRINTRLNYLMDPKVKLQGVLLGGGISDTNSFWGFDTSAMYGFSPAWPWIWLGYGVSGLYFKSDRIGYWSPSKFYNHGPRLDTSFPIFGAISGIIAANLNFYNEDKTKGDGFLIAAGLQWGLYDGNNVRILYTKIRSGQEQSPWIYEGLQATCTLLTF